MSNYAVISKINMNTRLKLQSYVLLRKIFVHLVQDSRLLFQNKLKSKHVDFQRLFFPNSLTLKLMPPYNFKLIHSLDLT